LILEIGSNILMKTSKEEEHSWKIFNPLEWISNLVHVDFELTDQDMKDVLDGENLVLGVYSKEATWKNFQEYGILAQIESKGYHELELNVDTSDNFVHRLTLTDKTISSKSQGNNFLMDMYVRRRDFRVTDFKSSVQNIEFLEATNVMEKKLNFTLHLSVIEWLCMQNPLKTFDQSRPQLPGQRHPGLGVGKRMADMLIHLAETHDRDGLMNVPEHFHNALIYFVKDYMFVNPAFQGFFLGLIYDL